MLAHVRQRLLAGPRACRPCAGARDRELLHAHTVLYFMRIHNAFDSKMCIQIHCVRVQPVDIQQISDKFPNREGGLRELFQRGPEGAFYLVKIWADINLQLPLGDDALFFGSSTMYDMTSTDTDTYLRLLGILSLSLEHC